MDEIAAFYISKGLSPAVAEAEAEADIRYYKHTQHDNIQDELYGMGLSPETVAAFAELIADNHNDVNVKSIQRYTQRGPPQYETISFPRIVVRRTNLKGPAEDNTTLPTNPDQPEVFNSAPATPRAEGETMPDAAKPTTPIQLDVGMSVRKIFQCAFVQAQLSRLPDTPLGLCLER